ncbi:MAG: putative selenoprotein [Acidobacteriia bacterium]|nr:putative selenoprotein [Terriglobia bacterium]
MRKMREILSGIWAFARELVGDNAYARYCDHVSARGGSPLTPEEFYISRLERKYSRPNRCC